MTSSCEQGFELFGSIRRRESDWLKQYWLQVLVHEVAKPPYILHGTR